MTDKGVTVTVDAKDFQKALSKLPRLMMSSTVEAGHKIGKFVLEQEGLRRYPPETAANQPPEPYYIRGKGTQYITRGGVSYNKGESEQYGDNWSIKAVPMRVTIGNKVTYAQYLAGKNQARHMRRIGWRKLKVVIMANMNRIRAMFQSAMGKAIRMAGFRFK